MTLSLYDASVPVFTRGLTNLRTIFDKAEANALERKIDLDVLFRARLAPDMRPLSFQVQTATDSAKGAAARLAGQPVPSWPDDEHSYADLKARIDKALQYLGTVDLAAFEGREDASVTLKVRGADVTLPAMQFLLERAIPNFYFHLTTAYAILRHNGVPIGKSDYLG